ncbi:MAG: DUF4296 domain-containing protein [Bacteroidales bacterium]
MPGKKVYLVFLISLLIWGCTTKLENHPDPPENLIHRDTMVNIIVDLRLFEAKLTFQQKKVSKTFGKYKLYLHNSVMEKYHIDRDQFDESFEYYQYDLKTLDGIYADAITRLSKIKSQVEIEK